LFVVVSVGFGDDLLTATGRARARAAGETGGGAAGLAACGELMLDTIGVGVVACPAIVVESANAGGDFASDTYGHLIGYSPKEVADWKAKLAAEPSPQKPPNDTDWNLARHGQSRVPIPGDLWGATMPSDEEIYHSFYVRGPDYGFATPHVSGRTADKLAAEEEARAASDRSRQEVVDHQRSERDDAAAKAQPSGGDQPSDAPTSAADSAGGGSGNTIDAGYVEPPAADQAPSNGNDTGADFSAYTPDVGDEIEIAA
jgi:hypothetical protein